MRVIPRLLDRFSQPAGRNFTVLPDDTMVVSYPRSGNTWMRFLLAALLEPDHTPGFATTSDVVPDIYNESDRVLRKKRRPRVIKSHEPLDTRYGRTLYMVRDPRDVALSYYHYLVHFRPQREDRGFTGFIEDFIAGDVPYGSWNDHVSGWVGARDDEDGFLVVRYEDLHAEPHATLHKVAGFAGIPADADAVERAIHSSTFDEMRSAEKKHLGEVGSDRSRFVREGQAFGWKNKMSDDDAESIARACESAMRLVGYS